MAAINDTNDSTTEDPTTIDFGELANVAMDRIAEHAITHPMRTLALAAGVGYTLGRGIPSFVVRIGMLFGARIVTNALVSASLEQIGATMRGDVASDDAPSSDAPSTKTSKRRANGRFEGRRSSTASAGARD